MSQISVLVDPATGEVIDKASGRVVGMAGEGHFASLAVLPAPIDSHDESSELGTYVFRRGFLAITALPRNASLALIILLARAGTTGNRIRITHAQLADAMNISRRYATDALAMLKKRGLVAVERRSVILLNPYYFKRTDNAQNRKLRRIWDNCPRSR